MQALRSNKISAHDCMQCDVSLLSMININISIFKPAISHCFNIANNKVYPAHSNLQYCLPRRVLNCFA